MPAAAGHLADRADDEAPGRQAHAAAQAVGLRPRREDRGVDERAEWTGPADAEGASAIVPVGEGEGAGAAEEARVKASGRACRR